MVTEMALVMPEAIGPISPKWPDRQDAYCISETYTLFMPNSIDISRAMYIVSRETMYAVVKVFYVL
jgi:hypothetical protein